MSPSYHHSLTSSPETTDELEHKEKLEATSAVFSAETSAGLDFLRMPEDELFGNPDDTPDEIQGSLERLERLLQPVEHVFNPFLRHFEPMNETAEISPHAISCRGNELTRTDVAEEVPKLNISQKGHLPQSVESITRLRNHNFMHLSMRYASHESDPRFDFDQLTSEPVLTLDGSPRNKRNEYQVKQTSSRSDDKALGEREEPPTLIMAGSASPPLEDQLTTPKDGDYPTVQQYRCAEKWKQERNFSISESVTPHSAKRRDHESRNSGNDDSRESLVNNAVRRGDANAREMNKVTGLHHLSTRFIVDRFGIKPVHDSSHRWQCPFSEHDVFPDGKCLAPFDSESIRRHVADHVEAHRKTRPHETLECPYRKTGKGCAWKETTGPNKGLPRHVAEVHLKSNAHKCACGTSFARGSRDQFVRHLRDGHRKKLEMKRRTDQAAPDFVDIDDANLVEEEKKWSQSMGKRTEKEEDDRGEGSSKGVKRARRF